MAGEWVSLPGVCNHGRSGPSNFLLCSDMGYREMSPLITSFYQWQVGELALGTSVQEIWPCLSSARAFRRGVLTRHLDSTVEMALDVGVVGEPGQMV